MSAHSTSVQTSDLSRACLQSYVDKDLAAVEKDKDKDKDKAKEKGKDVNAITCDRDPGEDDVAWDRVQRSRLL